MAGSYLANVDLETGAATVHEPPTKEEDALPVLTGDPMTTSTSFVQGSADRETLEQLSDAELLRRAARQVLKVLCMVEQDHAGLRAATAVLTETTQPTANPGK